VAVLQRCPGVGKAFVVADRTAVVALLNRSAPGTAAVSQVWINAPGDSLGKVRDLLGSTPASTATVTFRSELEQAIGDDPVATRSILLLGWAGTIALLLAMVAAAAAVRADLEESRTDQLALELDGLTPGRLRRRLLTRAGLVAVVGTPLGIAGGVLLTVIAVRLLVTGPGGGAVIPPLRPVLGALPLLAVVGAAVLGVALASAATALSALREPFPRTIQTDLR
jgi:predicted lysophospholipase L1 biosynthesis ABC-type transport system permease subunit